MAPEEPEKEEMEQIREEIRQIMEEIKQTEDEELETEELISKIAEEGPDEEHVREVVEEQEEEVAETEQEEEQLEQVEEQEKGLLDLYGDLENDLDSKEKQINQQIISGLDDMVEEIKQNPSVEGLGQAIKQSGKAVQGVLSVSNEELAGAEGLGDLSELVLQTAKEEEQIVKELEEEEGLVQKAGSMFSQIGFDKGEQVEKKLEEEDKQEEQMAVQELRQVEELTEMDEEEIQTLREEIERSQEEARNIYGDLEQLARVINDEGIWHAEKGETVNPKEVRESFNRSDRMKEVSRIHGRKENLSDEKREEYMEKLTEEQKELKEAMNKMNQALDILEEAQEYASQAESIEQETEGEM